MSKQTTAYSAFYTGVVGMGLLYLQQMFSDTLVAYLTRWPQHLPLWNAPETLLLLFVLALM